MEGIIKFNLTKDYIIDLRGEKVQRCGYVIWHGNNEN